VDKIMALLAFVVAAMYVVIAFAVLPRLARVEPGRLGLLRLARWGAMAFFTGCAVTHVGIGVDALGVSTGMPEMAGGSNWVMVLEQVLPHVAQIIGGGLFLGIARRHLEWSVLPTEVALELHEREIQLRSAFERAPVGMALIGVGRERGQVLRANPALSALMGRSGDALCVGRYRDLFVTSDQNDADAGVESLVRGDVVLDRELRLVDQGGGYTWVGVGITMARDDHGAAMFAVAQIRDITDQRHTDLLRAAQHAVMQAVSGGDSLSAGLDQVLDTVCAALGWAGGEYWQADTARRGILRVTSRWSPPFADFTIARAGELMLGRGQGVPGAVWAKGARIWISDLVQQPGTFTRIAEARDAGVNAVIGLPIRSGGQSGVLMFFAAQMPEPDQEMTTALEGISAHVGKFVERRRAEALLLRSLAQAEQFAQDRIALVGERRRLRQAEAIGRVGSWEWDLTNDQMVWSQALFELCGVETATLSDREAFDQCTHPDDLLALSAAVRACADDGESFVHEYRIVRLDDGTVREFETRGERLPLVEGDPVLVAGMAMDVTDRVRAQSDAVARQEMLRAILANSSSLIYVKDLDGRYLMVNEQFERHFSVVEADLVGRDDTALDPVLAPIWQANDRRAQQGRYTLDEWTDSVDGRRHLTSVKFPINDGSGHLTATGGISEDVTGRRHPNARPRRGSTLRSNG
jgi:PAS domain S-box-containing protein